MTELERLKEQYKTRIEEGEEARKKLDSLIKMKEVSNLELYTDITSFFTLNTYTGKFKRILGGDGRSRPWDEDASGIITEIELLTGIFFNSKQKEIILDAVKNIKPSDHYEFI